MMLLGTHISLSHCRPNNNQFSTISYKWACKLDASRSKNFNKWVPNQSQACIMIFSCMRGEQTLMKSEQKIFFGKQQSFRLEQKKMLKAKLSLSHTIIWFELKLNMSPLGIVRTHIHPKNSVWHYYVAAEHSRNWVRTEVTSNHIQKIFEMFSLFAWLSWERAQAMWKMWEIRKIRTIFVKQKSL